MNCSDCTKDLTHETAYIWRKKARCEQCNEDILDEEYESNEEDAI